MVKHTETIRQHNSKNYLNVFYQFVGLALKGLKNPLRDNIKHVSDIDLWNCTKGVGYKNDGKFFILYV